VVTLGVRSITAAALAGITFTLLPGVFQTYVPARWAAVPILLFGLGALGVALHPEGAVVYNGRQLRQLGVKLLSRNALEPSQVWAGKGTSRPKAGVTP
jgi:branched-chain amino acid transport system permease protein